jgi:hypothetical protein
MSCSELKLTDYLIGTDQEDHAARRGGGEAGFGDTGHDLCVVPDCHGPVLTFILLADALCLQPNHSSVSFRR